MCTYKLHHFVHEFISSTEYIICSSESVHMQRPDLQACLKAAPAADSKSIKSINWNHHYFPRCPCLPVGVTADSASAASSGAALPLSRARQAAPPRLAERRPEGRPARPPPHHPTLGAQRRSIGRSSARAVHLRQRTWLSWLSIAHRWICRGQGWWC